MRSPSSAPWVNGEDGSIDSTPTVRPAARRAFVTAPMSADLPTPRRTGEADHLRPARVRVDLPDELPALRAVVLDQRDRRAPARGGRRRAGAGRAWGSVIELRNHRRARVVAPAPRRSLTIRWLWRSLAIPPLRFPRRGARRRVCGGPPAAVARRTAGARAVHARQPHAQPGLRRCSSRYLSSSSATEGACKRTGVCFVCPGVKFEIGRDATLRSGAGRGSATPARSARTRAR